MPDCGCVVRRNCVFLPEGPMELASTIRYCPMHAAAAEMMGLLTAAAERLDELSAMFPVTKPASDMEVSDIRALLLGIKEADHA